MENQPWNYLIVCINDKDDKGSTKPFQFLIHHAMGLDVDHSFGWCLLGVGWNKSFFFFFSRSFYQQLINWQQPGFEFWIKALESDSNGINFPSINISVKLKLTVKKHSAIHFDKIETRLRAAALDYYYASRNTFGSIFAICMCKTKA